MELKKKYFTFSGIFRCFRREKHKFSYRKNPNFPKRFPKTDSFLLKKFNSRNFLEKIQSVHHQRKKNPLDEGILVKKNSRSQILGDLNAKGSIIRGITGNNKDNRCNLLWICKLQGKLSKDVSILASISDHRFTDSSGWLHTKLCRI